MKVYGFDSIDIQRGEVRAAEVDADWYHDFPDNLRATLDWECMDTAFARVRRALIEHMQRENVPSDLIETVRTMRASYVPVSEGITQ